MRVSSAAPATGFRTHSEETTLGQELTVVLSGSDRALNLAQKVASALGGSCGVIDASAPNGSAWFEVAGKRFVVEIDGAVPGVGAVVEVKTPPLNHASEALLARVVPALHKVGNPDPSYGGGHIHIDGARLRAEPTRLAKLLSLYVAREQDWLSAHRSAARCGQAQGFAERYHGAQLDALQKDFAALAKSTPASLAADLSALYTKYDMPRTMALNLRSLAGVLSGNKASKGTLEFRLFDTPKNADACAAQHALIRALIAEVFSDAAPAPAPAKLVAPPLQRVQRAAITPAAAKASQASAAALLPGDRRSNALAITAERLGYSQTETWYLSASGIDRVPSGESVPVTALKNPETQAIVIMHETPAAAALWKSLVRQGVRWSGRFSWSDAPSSSGTLEGLIVLRAGATPAHFAEEHFHHQFARAEIQRLKAVDFPLKHEVPRIADTEGYAAVMAHRFITGEPALKEWEWNGHTDIAARYASLSNREVLELGLTRGFDLPLIASASSRLGIDDHFPERPARNPDRLAEPELEGVGISRTSQAGLWDWDKARALPIAWGPIDVAWLGGAR